MPLLNTQGRMVAMRRQGTSLFTAAEYQAFIAQRTPFTNAPPNRLQAAWENGITAYYAHNYQAAITSFAQVETLNPNLKAATHFKQQAAAQLNTSQGSPSGSNTVTSFFGIPRSTFLIIVIIAGFLLLIVLLIIARTWARRRHELARFESERAEVQRNAEEKLLQRQKAQQNIMPVEKPNQVSLLLDNASSGRNVSTINSQSPPDTLCPNCGHAVRAGATYCPNCRYQLSPLSRDVPPTLDIFPVLELPIIDKALAPSTTSFQPEQARVKEAVLDDLAIQATLKRLWDKAGR